MTILRVGRRAEPRMATLNTIHLRFFSISEIASSRGIGTSPEALASAQARISSSSSNSSRSFSYSSISIMTAILSPFSLVKNRVGFFIASLLIACRGDFQNGEEGFLGDIDLADALHALLAFFLFFEEFALTRDVAAVAFGQNVFANGRDGFARDHAAANRGLNGHLEHLPRNQFAQARHQVAPALVRLFAMANHGQRVYRLATHQNVELDEVRFAVASKVIIERGVAARNGFQPVVKIEDDFVERQFVGEHDARR